MATNVEAMDDSASDDALLGLSQISTPRSTSVIPPASPLNPPAPVEAEKDLLSIRKDYKKITTNLARVKSHLSFISSCSQRHVTPRGLRVNVTCNAFLSGYTEVRSKFDFTKKDSESKFVSHLTEHYTKCKTELENQLVQIKEIEDLIKRETPPDKWKEHQELLLKTDDNVLKQSERLETRKRKKIEHLQGKPVSEGNKGGAMKPKGNRGRGRGRGRKPSPKQPNNQTPPPGLPAITPEEADRLIQILTALREPGGAQPPSLQSPPGQATLRGPSVPPAGSSRPTAEN